jgi:hypothetical protein
MSAWIECALLPVVHPDRAMPFVAGPRMPGRFWSCPVLASLLVLLSTDRAMAFEQQLGDLVDRSVQAGRSFYAAWGMPGLLFCLGLLLVCLPLIRSLPRGGMVLVALVVLVLLLVLPDVIVVADGLFAGMFGSRPALP